MLKVQNIILNERFRNSLPGKVISFVGRYIDYPTAFAGALLMGIIVGLINRNYGMWPAFTAALKQAVYTFFFGGMLTRLLYTIVMAIRGKLASVFISVSTVTLITVTLVFLVHNMKGTPMPLESTLPTALLAPFGFSFLAYRKKSR